MKLSDALNDQYPDNAMTVEAVLERFVKKPWIDGSDEERLSATDVLIRLGGVDSYRQARRAIAWFKKNGFNNYADEWCWRVAFKSLPVVPVVII